jgi:hypothetical protein
VFGPASEARAGVFEDKANGAGHNTALVFGKASKAFAGLDGTARNVAKAFGMGKTAEAEGGNNTVSNP